MRVGLIGGCALVAALVFAVCVSGCGSSSSSTTTETTAAITQAEFVAKGNAICVKGEKAQEAAVNAYFKKHGIKEHQKPTKAQLTEVAETVLVPNIQSQIDGVKALGAPSGEEQQVSAALETAQQTLDRVKANPTLAFENENLFAATGKQLHALGLKKCAPNS
jgi:hypothetical protein